MKSLAESIRAKGKMCAHGGPAMCSKGCYAEGGEALMKEALPQNKHSISKLDSSEIAKSIRAKKMAAGGMVDEDEDFEELPEETEADDFLSDDKEMDSEPSEEEKKKSRLSKILSRGRRG